MASTHRMDRASVSGTANPRFNPAGILRRFSTPSPYTVGATTSSPGHQTSPLPEIQVTGSHDLAQNDFPSATPLTTPHTYAVKSRGKDYAAVVILSHAQNVRDSPLLYYGEDITGAIVVPLDHFERIQTVEVVLQMYESDPIRPSYETKRSLTPETIDPASYAISNGQVRWPFVMIVPIAAPVLSSGASALSVRAGSSNGHSHGHGSEPKIQLSVTIFRHGRLNQNVGAGPVQIRYSHPPEPSPSSSDESNAPASPSWAQQKFPPVLVKGVIFQQWQVHIECRLTAPASYPVSDYIPLRLALTSESRQALDLVAVSHAIDVRLLKVVAFGGGAAIRPLTLLNRSSYHRTDWVAREAHWDPEGPVRELPPDEHHPRPRFRVRLSGSLHCDPRIQMEPSFEHQGTALMYLVCLFPFRSNDFRPSTSANRELLMAPIPLTAQH
ncbi:hypothetical protein BC834DRAFT_975189 [Gloeopeniophorella convolvens]|nr:hypothetical protein BC834DRAFT_975189 [Gloeopeniophorella convolvens]